MNRRMLLNLGLLLLVLALALVIWLDPGIDPEAQRPRITPLTADDVTHVSIQRSSGADLVLEKEDGSWLMVFPVRTYANEFRIDPLLRVVEAVSHTRFPAAGRDLGEYRLDPPLIALRLNDVEIAFGGTEPIGNRRYAMIGDTIHLIEDHYYYPLHADYPAFVSNRLLLPASRPGAIDLPGLSLRRDDEGRWTASPPGDLTPDAINALIDEWVHAQALDIEHYREDEEAPRDFVRVAIGGTDGEIVFGLLADGQDVLLTRADLGLVYRLTEEQASRLLLPAPDAPSDR